MTVLRLLLLVLCILPTTASSYREDLKELEQTLAWDDPNPAGMVAGYVVYERVGVDWFELGKTDNTSFRVIVSRSMATFAVSCFNGLGIESERSAEITVHWPSEPGPFFARKKYQP